MSAFTSLFVQLVYEQAPWMLKQLKWAVWHSFSWWVLVVVAVQEGGGAALAAAAVPAAAVLEPEHLYHPRRRLCVRA